MDPTRILIVDDSGMNARLEALLLEAEGFTVRNANSSEQTLNVVKSYRPELILLLLPLRNEDGIELIRQLKVSPACTGTKMIALTADAIPAHSEQTRRAGCHGFIRQPIDRGTFVALVKKYLNGDAALKTNFDPEQPAPAVADSLFAEALEQCVNVLKQISDGQDGARGQLRIVARQWITLGDRVSCPEISDVARQIESLFTRSETPSTDLIEAELEKALVLFREAARVRLKLPLRVVTGLAGVRIGLMNFYDRQADRIRTALREAGIPGQVQQLDGDAIRHPSGLDALVINESDPEAQLVSDALHSGLPVVFVASRSLLRSLSGLPLQAVDFVTFPWDADEILIRVYRLLIAPRPSASPTSTGKIPGRKPRVLVVDDDPSIISIVDAALQNARMDCEAASSGPEALERIQRSAPDAIVLDVNMIGMDGFDVLMLLRRNPRTANIPVLFLTARRQESDVARGFGYGADDYLMKPFNPFELSIRVERIMSLHPENRALQIV